MLFARSMAGLTLATLLSGSALSQINTGAAQVAPAGAGGVAAGGSAQMFAVVDFDGTLARGKGALSAVRVNDGSYQVFFARNVTACAYTATEGSPANSFPAIAIMQVAIVAGSSNGVYVLARTLDGGTSDRPFHLYVDC